MTPRIGTFSGGGLGFGVAFTLQDQFSAVADKIQAKFTGLESAVNVVSDKIQASFGKIAAGAAMVWAGLEVLNPIKEGLDWAAWFETANVRLTTLLHSGEEAKRVMDALIKEEPYMPFDLPTLLNANTALIAAGATADRARESVDAVANAIAAVGGSTGEMSSAMMDLQKIYEIGYADKRHLMQLSYGARIPIIPMLEKSLGKSSSEIMGMKLTFDQIIQAMMTAAGKGGMFENALDKMAHTWTGKLTTLHTRVIFAWKAIGDAIFPTAKRLLDVVTDLMVKFTEFAQTGIGRVVVAAVVVGLVFTSLSLVLVGVIMLFEALAGVIGVILIEIAPFVVLGLAMVAVGYGMYRMLDSLNGAVVAFAFAIIALLMGPLGLLVAGIFILHKAWGEFNAVLAGSKPATGFLGFLQKLGGVLQGIWMIMHTANSEGFTLTDKMAEGLDRLGILDTVIALGTWIVRIREFGKGMWQGMAAAWHLFKDAVNWVLDRLKPVGDAMDKIGLHLHNQTSAMSKWKRAGEIAGYIIMGVLIELLLITTGLAVMFAILGVIMIVAFAPVLVTVALVSAAIWLLYEAVLKIIEGWKLFKEELSEGWSYISNLFNTGVQMVETLWAGIRSRWDAMMDWINAKVAASPVLKFVVGTAGDMAHPENTINDINDKFGMNPSSSISTPAAAGSVTPNGPSRFENLAANPSNIGSPSWMRGTPDWWGTAMGGSNNVVVKVYVDSDEVAHRIGLKSYSDDKRD